MRGKEFRKGEKLGYILEELYRGIGVNMIKYTCKILKEL